jgi:hypothetical protein
MVGLLEIAAGTQMTMLKTCCDHISIDQAADLEDDIFSAVRLIVTQSPPSLVRRIQSLILRNAAQN